MNDPTVTVTVTGAVSTLPFIFAKLQEIAAQPGGAIPATPADSETKALPQDGTAPATLTEAQARLFVENCSPKTLGVLRAILDGRAHPFRLSTLENDLGVTQGATGWVWGGLTKRTRNVLGDRIARLIVWDNILDNNGKWVDSDGKMAETTVVALRKALGIPG